MEKLLKEIDGWKLIDRDNGWFIVYSPNGIPEYQSKSFKKSNNVLEDMQR